MDAPGRWLGRLDSVRHTYEAAGLTTAVVAAFRAVVRNHYAAAGRDFPWRHDVTPYRVLVSELMLQQTQTARVAERFPAFVLAFPDFGALARASLQQVLGAWSGLGYNRRALALQRLAQRVVAEFAGELPDDVEALLSLPGLGPATARSVAAFAFDRPEVFLETNVRALYLHVFCHGRQGVPDDELEPLVERTLDRRGPGVWYNALMDLGALVKRSLPNPSRRSAHHVRQAPFEGSDRQLRGRLLAALTEGSATTTTLVRQLGQPKDRVLGQLERLAAEGFLRRAGARWTVA